MEAFEPDHFVADLAARKQTKAATLFALNELRVQQEHNVTDDRLEAIARDIESLLGTAILQLAERLAEAHEIFRYRREEGGFAGWVETRLRISRSKAYDLVHVHERFGGRSVQSLDKFPASVFYLLAAPSTPEEVRAQVIERAEGGKPVTVADVKQTIAAAKGRKAARRKSPADAQVSDVEASANARKAAAAIEQEQLDAVCRDANFSEPDGTSFPAESPAAAHAAQRKRPKIFEVFENVLFCISEVCANNDEMEIPPLSQEERAQAIDTLAKSIEYLSAMMRKIKNPSDAVNDSSAATTDPAADNYPELPPRRRRAPQMAT